MSGYLSPAARVRLLSEALVPARPTGAAETVAAFWRRRFGAEFVERVIDPLVGGLFAGRAEDLSMSAVFPALLEMERRYGSITRGVLGRWLAGGTMPARRLYAWRDGIGALPRALATRLGSAMHTGVPVRRVRPAVGGFRNEAGAAGAPEGHVALAGYIGGARAPEAALAAAGELIEAARAEFREFLGARGAAVVARVRQWPRGLPQYRLGHTVRVAALGALEDRRPGLFVTGNYIGGPSLGNCVAQAVETAARVERFLTGMPATRQRETAAVDAATPGRSGAAS